MRFRDFKFGHLKFSRWPPAAILNLIQPEMAPFDRQSPKTYPTLEPNMKRIGWRVAELWPFEIFAKCVNALRSVVFLGGLSHLCPKNFPTVFEKTGMPTCKITFPTHPTQKTPEFRTLSLHLGGWTEWIPLFSLNKYNLFIFGCLLLLEKFSVCAKNNCFAGPGGAAPSPSARRPMCWSGARVWFALWLTFGQAGRQRQIASCVDCHDNFRRMYFHDNRHFRSDGARAERLAVIYN